MKRTFFKICVVLLLLCLLLAACGKKKNVTDPALTEAATQQETVAENTELVLLMPWEADGAKPPEAYTLLEYEGLTAEQRKAFFNYLGAEAYAAWLERAEAEAEKNVEIPWKEAGSKQPREYTWAEYQTLSEAQQKAFMEALGPQGLEAWLKAVGGGSSSQSGNKTNSGSNSQSGNSGPDESFIPGSNHNQSNVQYPWEKEDGKLPEDYTWEEYDALSLAQQKAFRSYLGTEGFVEWLKKAEEAEYPWKAEGAKQPKDYTWEEYEVLTADQKTGFYQELGKDGFDRWLEMLQPKESLPWETPGAKQPKDYTWQEFNALSKEQQAAFQDHMGEAAFATWMNKAQNAPAINPWDRPGAKQPKDYTWQEFNDLSEEQQVAFQDHMGETAFTAWMNEAQNVPAINPWDRPGAKQPKDYTWEAFNALTGEQQVAFQDHLGRQGFENWMKKAKESSAEKPVLYPWDKAGAKQPADYTWEEFSALSGTEQVAFQKQMGKAFEGWLSSHQPKPTEKPTEPPVVYPWNKPGAKQPKDYTWGEFLTLTGDEQIAFQTHLGADRFADWLNRNQEKPVEKPSDPPAVNPWDKPGAKQPADYTWEEFIALPGKQQIAFQSHLGVASFEAWLNNVLGLPTEDPTEEPVVEPETEPTEEPVTEPVEEPAAELAEVSETMPVTETAENS